MSKHSNFLNPHMNDLLYLSDPKNFRVHFNSVMQLLGWTYLHLFYTKSFTLFSIFFTWISIYNLKHKYTKIYHFSNRQNSNFYVLAKDRYSGTDISTDKLFRNGKKVFLGDIFEKNNFLQGWLTNKCYVASWYCQGWIQRVDCAGPGGGARL